MKTKTGKMRKNQYFPCVVTFKIIERLNQRLNALVMKRHIIKNSKINLIFKADRKKSAQNTKKGEE